MDTTTLQSALVAFREDRDLAALKAALMEFFRIPAIAPELDAWLAGEEPPRGLYMLTSFERALEWVPSFQKLLDRYGDVPFPALAVGGDGDGVDFWLVLETGKVISLHHDATFYEEAGYIKAPDPAEFMRKFERVGSTFTLAQLCALNALTADLERDEDDEDLFGKSLLKAAAKALGLSLRATAKLTEESSFGIVHQRLGYIYDYPEDMEAFLDEEEPVEQ